MPIVFGSKRAKEILQANRELDEMSAFCPCCFEWDEEDRYYCPLCEGEGSVSARDVIAYFQRPWIETQCERYLEVMAARGDRTRDTLYALLKQIHVTTSTEEV